MKLYEKYLNEQDNVEIDEYLSDLEEAVFDLINSLDEDQFNEDQQDIIDDILELTEDDSEYIDEEINEVQRERVVRSGKKIRRLKRKPGYKVKNGRYVKISSSEKRARSKAAKKGARKRKPQRSSIQRKRKKSLRRR
jgi:hypothetical protein